MPSSGDLSDTGIEPASLTSPALADVFLTISAIWKAQRYIYRHTHVYIYMYTPDIFRGFISCVEKESIYWAMGFTSKSFNHLSVSMEGNLIAELSLINHN